MERIGYARVSTREEREVFDRQMDTLKAAVISPHRVVRGEC